MADQYEIIGGFSVGEKHLYVILINGNAHIMEKYQVDRLRRRETNGKC